MWAQYFPWQPQRLAARSLWNTLNVPMGGEGSQGHLGFPGGSDGNNSACNAGDPGLILGSGRSPGEGNGNPLQYSCLENPMDGSLVGYRSWGHKESDMTDRLTLSGMSVIIHVRIYVYSKVRDLCSNMQHLYVNESENISVSTKQGNSKCLL